ncbi:hypothetical protein M9H77_12559 [Catharanthus roseus]|uniref:Uncharacterized protein n=1 Tax=Catharanthus roseus TaxID=4058 RepID=A0ACC0BHU4_CATRO|nr:hypothetical protein M9H77_12559 [Catharanthus roseus]
MYRLYPSLRAATHISAILQERSTGPYHYWFEVLLDVHDMWWREFLKTCIWDPSLSMTKMRNQASLTERFSKIKHLEKLHKHQSGDKKGQYAKEEATAMGVPLSDDLQLMVATVSGGLDHSWNIEVVRRQLISELRAVGSQLDCHLVV